MFNWKATFHPYSFDFAGWNTHPELYLNVWKNFDISSFMQLIFSSSTPDYDSGIFMRFIKVQSHETTVIVCFAITILIEKINNFDRMQSQLHIICKMVNDLMQLVSMHDTECSNRMTNKSFPSLLPASQQSLNSIFTLRILWQTEDLYLQKLSRKTFIKQEDGHKQAVFKITSLLLVREDQFLYGRPVILYGGGALMSCLHYC